MPGLLTFENRFAVGFPANAREDGSQRQPTAGDWYDGTGALVSTFTTHAHAVMYEPVDIDGTLVRITKPSLKKGLIRSEDVRCAWVAIDVDLHLPDGSKGEWTEPLMQAAWAALQSLPFPYNSWLYWHTTQSGYHLWYLLDETVQPHMHEHVSLAVRLGLAGHGIETDKACSDWTRLIALPRVRKDSGIHTGLAPWFRESWQVNDQGGAQTLPLAALDLTGAAEAPAPVLAAAVADGRAISATAPREALGFSYAPSDALHLVYANGDPDVPTELGRVLRRAVENSLMRAGDHTVAAEQVLDGRSFPQGMRDTTIAHTMGWLVRRARDVADQGVTVDHLLGLVIPSCEATDHETGPQDDGRSWLDKAGTKILEYWKADDEEAIRKQAEDVRKAQLATTPDKLADILLGLTEDTALDRRTNENWGNHLKTYAVLATDRSKYYVLQPNGTYQGPVATLRTCLGNMKRSGVAVLLGAVWIDADTGKPKSATDARLLEDFSMPAHVANAVFHPSSSPADQTVLATRYFESHVELTERKHRPFEVKPRYSEFCARFLHVFTGSNETAPTEEYRQLLYWLSYLRDFEGSQLPMLYLYGAARTGKTLLGNAISMHAPTANPRAAGAKFNGAYASGVILRFDDAVPVQYGNYMQLKQALPEFLNVVSGQPIMVEHKFLDAAGVQYPWRVVLLDNSPRFFRDLMAAHSNYEDRDKRDALALRSILIRVASPCREWVRAHASGRDGLVEELAQHISWLNSNREANAALFTEYENMKEPGGMRLVNSTTTAGVAEVSMDESEIAMIANILQAVGAALGTNSTANHIVLTEEGDVLIVKGKLMSVLLGDSPTAQDRAVWKQASAAVFKLRSPSLATSEANIVNIVEGGFTPARTSGAKRRWMKLDMKAVTYFEPVLPIECDGHLHHIHDVCERVVAQYGPKHASPDDDDYYDKD